MTIESIIKKLGLTDKECKIYLTLVQNGPSKISVLARKSGMHRPTIYQTLPGLQSKGLVTSTIKGKQKIFIAEPPKKLLNLFEEFKQQFEEAMPEIEEMYQAHDNRPIVKVLEGKQAMKFIHDDLVNSQKRDDIYYRYTSNTDMKQLEKYLPKDYEKKRDDKSLQRYIINNEKITEQAIPHINRFIKTMPAKYGLFVHGVSQLIYANKIAFIDYNTETVLIIENKKIAEFQKTIYKALYDRI